MAAEAKYERAAAAEKKGTAASGKKVAATETAAAEEEAAARKKTWTTVMRTETAMIHKENTVEMAASRKVTILLEDRAVMTRGKDAAQWRTLT